MFNKVTAKFYLHLAPKFVNEPMKGVEDHLNRMLLKFNKDVGGVIMSYTNVQLLTDRATILFDSPFMHFHIACDLVVFSPAVGSRIRGVINKQSQTHIGLLVFNLFNVSIGNSDIPADQFVFEADTAAGGDGYGHDDAEAMNGRHDNRFRKAHRANTLTGNWVHTPTQTTLSVGTDLEFLVTEVVRSHDFINIKGSLSGIELSAQTPMGAAGPGGFAPLQTVSTHSKLVVFGDDDADADTEPSASIPPPTAFTETTSTEPTSELPPAKAEKRKRKRSQLGDAESAAPSVGQASEETAVGAAANTEAATVEGESKKSSKKSKKSSKKSSETTAVDGEKATKKRKKGGD